MSTTPPASAVSFCRRTRREYLWEMGGGFVGTALAWMLAQEGLLPAPAAAAAPHRAGLTPRPSHFPARAKAVIVLFMYGGVSQVDTWDPKPELNRLNGQPMPSLDSDPLLKVRSPGTLLGTKYAFRKGGQSGIEVSDLYPHLRETVDELCVVRGCYTDSFAHGSGLLQMNTGFIRQGYPSLGSWVTYGLGTLNQNLPAYVVMLDPRGGPISGPPNWGAGFMPATYQGTQFRVTGDPIIHLSPPRGRTTAEQKDQIALLRRLHEVRREEERAELARRLGARPRSEGPEAAELLARIQSYELAFRMQSHAPEAVDLSGESEETKRLYGLDQPVSAPFGQRCLLARRLVERGVRFVQIYSGGGHNDENWDAHGDVNKNHELHCAETDRPIAGLLADLKRRGLLDSTLVVWTGEFGRTPTGQNGKGRDHSPRGFTTWLAGGGVRGGTVVGATDELGYRAAENPVHVHDLHATILHLMGMDHTRLTYFHGGRDMRLTDVAGRVVREALR